MAAASTLLLSYYLPSPLVSVEKKAGSDSGRHSNRREGGGSSTHFCLRPSMKGRILFISYAASGRKEGRKEAKAPYLCEKCLSGRKHTQEAGVTGEERAISSSV